MQLELLFNYLSGLRCLSLWLSIQAQNISLHSIPNLQQNEGSFDFISTLIAIGRFFIRKSLMTAHCRSHLGQEIRADFFPGIPDILGTTLRFITLCGSQSLVPFLLQDGSVMGDLPVLDPNPERLGSSSVRTSIQPLVDFYPSLKLYLALIYPYMGVAPWNNPKTLRPRLWNDLCDNHWRWAMSRPTLKTFWIRSRRHFTEAAKSTSGSSRGW